VVADHLGTDHHEIVVGEDEPLAVLSEVLYHLESWDRDLVRSALPTYLVARFAATELKVVLAGEGADELFGGYRYHVDYIDDPETLQRELHRSVSAMHDSNLQRLDRMTMAHSLEARVPFLDPEVVEVAMSIPAELKLRRDGSGRPVEKWILRKAFEDLLPPEIVWRTKSQFDEGSGTVDRLPGLAAEAVGDQRPDAPGARVRDVEEAWYFSHVRSSLGDWRAVQDNTSAWEQGRLTPAA
jgi:asparagine synthase (glutamine-hydrolysing)